LFCISAAIGCSAPKTYSWAHPIGAQESLAECHTIANYKLSEGQELRVHHVADGDTFTACSNDDSNAKIKVRVLGIDCPESHENSKCQNDEREGRAGCAVQIPLGLAMKEHVISLLSGASVKLESRYGNGQFDLDTHGRTLAYVRLQNGDDLGYNLIKHRHCEDFSWRFPHPRQSDYLRASGPTL